MNKVLAPDRENPLVRKFRLIDYQALDGATNMAVDESLLESCLAGKSPPTLRFYSFSPSCVSLGYAQSLPPARLERIRNRGFDVVQRPTGGRAVLHHKELTYCFVGTTRGDDGEAAILSASVGAAYKQICQGLIAGLCDLGVPLEIGSAKAARKQPHDCFLATTPADLHFNGLKMVGSAQLRRKDGVLQHGSILLAQEQSLMSELLDEHEINRAGSNDSGAHHANLFDVLGRTVSMATLQQYLVRGFESAFSCTFEQSRLSKDEEKLVAELKGKSLVGASAL